MNHFEFFGLTISFDLDVAFVKTKYLLMQQKFHPDAAKSNIEKIERLENSMKLNEAYKTLLNDYLRAAYIFEILGINITAENSKNTLSHEELEKIWDNNEKLEKINNLEELYNFEKDILKSQKELTTRLKTAFRELLSKATPPGDTTDKSSETAIALTIKLKYLTNLVGNIRSKIKTLSSLP